MVTDRYVNGAKHSKTKYIKYLVYDNVLTRMVRKGLTCKLAS